MTLSFAAGAGVVGAAIVVVVVVAVTVAVMAKRRSEASAPCARSGAGLDDSFKLRKGTCRTPASSLEKLPMSPPPVGLHCDGSASVTV
jgi:hypothetical protein